MTPHIIENAISRDREPGDIVKMTLSEAHICGNIDCRTVSNCGDACPGCTSQVASLASLVENPLNSLAHEIAEESAKSDIESFCAWRHTDDGLLPTRWYNVATEMGDGERECVDRAVKYLEARGILRRNLQTAALVRWEGCGS
jgi:hypothetical protein